MPSVNKRWHFGNAHLTLSEVTFSEHLSEVGLHLDLMFGP
jgi:hypothetical protein